MNQSGPFFHPRPPFDALALSLPQGNLHVDGHGLAGRRCDLHLRALRQDLQQRFFPNLSRWCQNVARVRLYQYRCMKGNLDFGTHDTKNRSDSLSFFKTQTETKVVTEERETEREQNMKYSALWLETSYGFHPEKEGAG